VIIFFFHSAKLYCFFCSLIMKIYSILNDYWEWSFWRPVQEIQVKIIGDIRCIKHFKWFMTYHASLLELFYLITFIKHHWWSNELPISGWAFLFRGRSVLEHAFSIFIEVLLKRTFLRAFYLFFNIKIYDVPLITILLLLLFKRRFLFTQRFLNVQQLLFQELWVDLSVFCF